jgi:raffinose/stachyose/melibiose transport system permease protein
MRILRSARAKWASKITFYVVISIITVLVIFPVFVILNNSLKTFSQYMESPITPTTEIHLENYAKAWVTGEIGIHIMNSMFIVVGSILGVVLVSCFAAYGISRLEELTKIGTVLYSFLVAGIMVPPTTVIVQVFFLLQKLSLLNTRAGVVLCYLGAFLSVPILLMTGFFRTVPKELYDAVEIDGGGPVRGFFQVVVPLSRPIISTVVILLSVWLWNEYLYPYILIASDKKLTVQVGLQNMATVFWTDIPTMFAGVILSILPLIAVYLILQRQFIEGLSKGALKG